MKRAIFVLLFLFFVLTIIPPYFTNDQSLLYIPLFLVFLSLMILTVKNLPWSAITGDFRKDRIGSSKNIIEIFALLFAGFFFLYHFVANLDITDLSLDIETKRQKADSTGATYLTVDVKLSKGSVASADLQSIKAYLYDMDSVNVSDSMQFRGYEKMTIYPKESYIDNPAITYVVYADSTEKEEKYTMAANESTQFSSIKRLKDNRPYRVEVTVVTRRTKLLHKVNAQYRAAAISLPASETER